MRTHNIIEIFQRYMKRREIKEQLQTKITWKYGKIRPAIKTIWQNGQNYIDSTLSLAVESLELEGDLIAISLALLRTFSSAVLFSDYRQKDFFLGIGGEWSCFTLQSSLILVFGSHRFDSLWAFPFIATAIWFATFLLLNSLILISLVNETWKNSLLFLLL